jgi:dihydroneopterin aldolase
MKGTVELSGMEFHAFHGVLEQERREGNLFKVDLRFSYNAGKAAASDSIGDAIDYGAVYDIVAREMAVPSNLLENVAWRIREAVCEAFPSAFDVSVKVSKNHPPVSGKVEWSSVEI